MTAATMPKIQKRKSKNHDIAFPLVNGIFLCVLMFVTRHNEWVLCLSVAAVFQLYTAFRIPSELEKEK